MIRIIVWIFRESTSCRWCFLLQSFAENVFITKVWLVSKLNICGNIVFCVVCTWQLGCHCHAAQDRTGLDKLIDYVCIFAVSAWCHVCKVQVWRHTRRCVIMWGGEVRCLVTASQLLSGRGRFQHSSESPQSTRERVTRQSQYLTMSQFFPEVREVFSDNTKYY